MSNNLSAFSAFSFCPKPYTQLLNQLGLHLPLSRFQGTGVLGDLVPLELPDVGNMLKWVIFYDAYYRLDLVHLELTWTNHRMSVHLLTARISPKTMDTTTIPQLNYQNTTMTQVDATVKTKGPITKC